MNQISIEDALLTLLQKPMRQEEIDRAFPETGRRELRAALQALLREGKIMKNKKNRYAVISHFGFQIGTFLKTQGGTGFISPQDKQPEDKDFIVLPAAFGGAWHGDTVLFRPTGATGKFGREVAAVGKVLARASTEVTGTLRQRGKHFSVMPLTGKQPEVQVARYDIGDAQPGDRVAASISHYGDTQLAPQGKVTASFGANDTMGASILSILHENGISEVFPDAVLAQAASVSQTVDLSTAGDRLDLRDVLIFTIDGDDAKDFDDAVSVEPLANGHYKIGVHIADVSHYVRPGSPIDEEAFSRGTSVYFPGQVIPMLPFSLSHGICSLNPDVERLTFSAMIEVDVNGRRYGASFAKSVIRSKARMTYRKVNDILDGDSTLYAQYAHLVPTIEKMNQLAEQLHKKRMARGALELDVPEAQIIMDENGLPVDVQYRSRGKSEKLIEEFMLLANEAVAEFMQKKAYPTVYRVHENPDPEKLRVFASFAKPFGYRVNPAKPEDTAQLQAVLDGARGNPKQRVLSTLLLRSLARARYSEECLGHYGLHAQFYLHFTSPIRRYPDLMAHRMLQKILAGEMFTSEDIGSCQEAAKQSTTREQAADNAERDIEKLYLALYMKPFIGEEFDAEVSGVQSYGVFVALQNGCEGLVRVELLSGYYEYDAEHMVLANQHNGKRLTIGTTLRVRLIAANEITGQIDFAPDDASESEIKRALASRTEQRRIGSTGGVKKGTSQGAKAKPGKSGSKRNRRSRKFPRTKP